MSAWYESQVTEGDEKGFVVVECQLGASRAAKPLPRWKREALDRLSVVVSVAEAKTLALIMKQLSVVMVNTANTAEQMKLEWPWQPPKEGTWKLKSARLCMQVDKERADRIVSLLAQEEKPYGYTNSYRFIFCADHPDQYGNFQAISELAAGGMQEGKRGKRYKKTIINATAGLQQLIATYMRPIELLALPKSLRSGLCQEVAQQVTSCLGNLCSSKVRGGVMFPTTEDRDPERRKAQKDAAIDALVSDVRLLERVPARELMPLKFKADDPKGDRLLICDERWRVAVRNPYPHQLPLFFVKGDDVVIQSGSVDFDAGLSKRARHRGTGKSSEHVRSARSKKVQDTGKTSARAYYALLPILDAEDDEFSRVLARADAGRQSGSEGRGADFNLSAVPLFAGVKPKRSVSYMRLPLSFDRRRFEQLLNRTDISVAWSKVISRGEKWYLQLTLRVPFETPKTPRPILAVTFDLGAVATWELMDFTGGVVATGSMGPNEQIVAFLSGKQALEWDQQKGRWVGSVGRRFAPVLESIAHGVTNSIVDLARTHGAVLSVHDVDYVPKSGSDSRANQLFSAWNFGQLRRQLEYKSQLAGLGKPCFVSDFLVRFTCPQCGACRSKKDPKDAPQTALHNGVLACKKCGRDEIKTPSESAHTIAEIGLQFWNRFWERQSEG